MVVITISIVFVLFHAVEPGLAIWPLRLGSFQPQNDKVSELQGIWDTLDAVNSRLATVAHLEQMVRQLDLELANLKSRIGMPSEEKEAEIIGTGQNNMNLDKLDGDDGDETRDPEPMIKNDKIFKMQFDIDRLTTRLLILEQSFKNQDTWRNQVDIDLEELKAMSIDASKDWAEHGPNLQSLNLTIANMSAALDLLNKAVTELQEQRQRRSTRDSSNSPQNGKSNSITTTPLLFPDVGLPLWSLDMNDSLNAAVGQLEETKKQVDDLTSAVKALEGLLAKVSPSPDTSVPCACTLSPEDDARIKNLEEDVRQLNRMRDLGNSFVSGKTNNKNFNISAVVP